LLLVTRGSKGHTPITTATQTSYTLSSTEGADYIRTRRRWNRGERTRSNILRGPDSERRWIPLLLRDPEATTVEVDNDLVSSIIQQYPHLYEPDTVFLTELPRTPPPPPNPDPDPDLGPDNDESGDHEMPFKPPKPPQYKGEKDNTIIENWILSVDNFISCFTSALTPVQVYTTVYSATQGPAALWFRTQYPGESAGNFDWTIAKAALRAYFQPINFRDNLIRQYHGARQTSDVTSYAFQFRDLVKQLKDQGMTVDDTMATVQFIDGLKPRTKNEIKIRAPANLLEAISMATRYDTLAFASPTVIGHYEYIDNRGEPMQLDELNPENPDTPDTIAAAPLRVYPSTYTRKPGPQGTPLAAANVPRMKLTEKEREEARRRGECFKCRKFGHLARDCPEKTLTPKTTASPSSSPVPKNEDRQ
jgi:hypothetical protein